MVNILEFKKPVVGSDLLEFSIPKNVILDFSELVKFDSETCVITYYLKLFDIRVSPFMMTSSYERLLQLRPHKDTLYSNGFDIFKFTQNDGTNLTYYVKETSSDFLRLHRIYKSHKGKVGYLNTYTCVDMLEMMRLTHTTNFVLKKMNN